MNAMKSGNSAEERQFAELTYEEVQAVSGGTAFDIVYGTISPYSTTAYLYGGRWETLVQVTRQ